jgi:hypothetical protein
MFASLRAAIGEIRGPSHAVWLYARASDRRGSRLRWVGAQVVTTENVGTFTIVDLAGSERVKKSGATGQTMNEAQVRTAAALSTELLPRIPPDSHGHGPRRCRWGDAYAVRVRMRTFDAYWFLRTAAACLRANKDTAAGCTAPRAQRGR